jgi:hypothetical protein
VAVVPEQEVLRQGALGGYRGDVTATVPTEVKEISQAMKNGTYKFFGHNRSETKYPF